MSLDDLSALDCPVPLGQLDHEALLTAHRCPSRPRLAGDRERTSNRAHAVMVRGKEEPETNPGGAHTTGKDSFTLSTPVAS
jgi:hypothetical protein